MIISLQTFVTVLAMASLPLSLQASPALEDEGLAAVEQSEDSLKEAVVQPDIETNKAVTLDVNDVTLPEPSLDVSELEPISEEVIEPRPELGDETAVTEPPAVASVQPALVTGDAQTSLLRDIAASLASVETAKGRFLQIAPDGDQTAGDFYIRRPGRVRFEYDDPVPILIVADGATVAIEDRDLETQDRVPLRTTPLAILLDDELDFEKDAEILSVQRANGFVAVALRDRSGETDGTLDMIFTDESLELVAWQATDAAGGLTGVQLSEVETGVRISPRLFRIEELDEDEGRD